MAQDQPPKNTNSAPSVGGAPSTQRPRKILVLTATGNPSDAASRLFRFEKDRIVLGSVISGHVRLTGEGVSPIHAVLELLPNPTTGEWEGVVYDLASDTGLFVNEAKVVTQVLREKDIIRIGSAQLAFTLADAEQFKGKDRINEGDGRKLFLNPSEDFVAPLMEDGREVREIFDYRPATAKALEVVMSWHGVILAVEHFVDEKAVTVGKEKWSDFSIPPLLSKTPFPIARREGDSFVLNIDPFMKGVMHRKGRLETFESIRKAAGKPDEAIQVKIEKEDFAKVSIADIVFYLSFTAAPPRLKRSRIWERDALFFKILLSSILFTGVAIYGLLTAKVPQAIEAEQIPDRIATILYQPEKYIHPPKREYPSAPKIKETTHKPNPPVKIAINPNSANAHKAVPKEMNVGANAQQASAKNAQHKENKAQSVSQHEAKEGKGARANGAEGSRGSANGKNFPEKQVALNRPAPNGGAGKGGGKSQVPDEGNVDFLKGASSKIQNLLGNSAAHLGKGGEKLKGFGGFSSLGNDGLALSGQGKGGGGNANSLGGLSTQGKGGGRVGTGLGAAGAGNGIIGGQTRIEIRSGGPEETVVMGAIDADAVEAALLAHKDEFRLCYEREINAETPKITGRVGTNFTIGSSGRVTQGAIESSTLESPAVERCIVAVIKRIQFPIPRGGGVVQVTYPFKFSSVGR